jgi:outer membrane protein assembly factor BamB
MNPIMKKFQPRRGAALALCPRGALALRRRAALALAPAALLAACGDDSGKAKFTGTPVPVLPVPNQLQPAPDAPAVALPAAQTRDEWPQVLAGPAHAPGNVAGPTGLTQSWQASAGTKGGYRQPLAASPIIAAGKVFTMDANGNVAAFSLRSGNEIWRCYTRPKHNSEQNLSGGIAYYNGTIYASTGYAELLSIDAGAGKINWRQKLDLPARSAPTIAGNLVALIEQNDILVTFDAATGTPGWRFVGDVQPVATSVAVSGPPAYDSGIIVAGFASGTLAALDANAGTPIWEQSFSSAFGQASPLDFSDIVASPVIANGVVYAVGLGQTMQAIDLRAGNKVWGKEISGTQAIYAAGGYLFALDNNQTLAAIHADDGLVCWTLQMPAFKNAKKKSNPIAWAGPVMVNGALLLTSDHGELASVDPVAGKITSTSKIDGPCDMPPVTAGGIMAVLTRNAALTAYS